MECLICKGNDIKVKTVREEIKNGNDIIFIDITIPVCRNCGERYYDRRTMQELEKIKDNIKNEKLKEIGKVMEVIK